MGGGMSGRQKWSETLRMGSVPGCAVLLLVSLLVLSTGSDARRIRKRGLNHKVKLVFFFFFAFLFAILLPQSFTIGDCCRQLPSHHEGSFAAEVRGHRVDMGQPPWVQSHIQWRRFLTVQFSNATGLFLFPSCYIREPTASFDFSSV